MSVVIETTIGDITVDLFTEERPVACLNFIKLCKLKYYNFNLFHTVEHGFIAQTGDPTGSGNGGSSVLGVIEGPTKRFFEAENLPKIKHDRPGLLSLVSVGKQLVGSQFFLTLAPDLTSLDGIHCVIGEVAEGHETLRKLNESIVDEKFRPFQDIRITHTVILDDPYPDPRAFRVPSRSPSPSSERLANSRIGADEEIDDTDGKTTEEIQEMLEEKEAKARATILEIVGDLPDADMAPPENVLFVCKLNPITTDDDLEIIFGRFGKVKNCEVIRDKKSGDSLQYAFVEFKDKSACEAAYFKMDNVLIDDRRIHVDFSQSIAKVKWRGKGRGVEGVEGRLDFNKLKSDNTSWNQQRSEKEAHRSREKRFTSDDSKKYSRHTREKARERSNSDEGREKAHHSRERDRLTSTERRKAREERHRAAEREDNSRYRARSRSRDRKHIKDTRRYRNEDSTNNRCESSPKKKEYRNDNSDRRQAERDNLKKRCSPELRRRAEHQGSEKPRDNHSCTQKHISRNSTHQHVYKKNVKEGQLKKHRPRNSSDSSSDSSESDSSTSSSESSSQSTTSSSTSSSSEDNKRKKRKSSQRKKNLHKKRQIKKRKNKK